MAVTHGRCNSSPSVVLAEKACTEGVETSCQYKSGCVFNAEADRLLGIAVKNTFIELSAPSARDWSRRLRPSRSCGDLPESFAVSRSPSSSTAACPNDSAMNERPADCHLPVLNLVSLGDQQEMVTPPVRSPVIQLSTAVPRQPTTPEKVSPRDSSKPEEDVAEKATHSPETCKSRSLGQNPMLLKSRFANCLEDDRRDSSSSATDDEGSNKMLHQPCPKGLRPKLVVARSLAGLLKRGAGARMRVSDWQSQLLASVEDSSDDSSDDEGDCNHQISKPGVLGNDVAVARSLVGILNRAATTKRHGLQPQSRTLARVNADFSDDSSDESSDDDI